MATPIWNVELHSHSIYSKDCLTKLERIPRWCQDKGIDRLAITDHNAVAGALQLARMHPMLIIPGIEVMTTKGELLAWYITDHVPAGKSPEETIAVLREQGAFISVSHPFDRYRKGAWRQDDLEAIVDLVDAIEVFNARCIKNEDNQKALQFAIKHSKTMTNGSDAHSRREYGRATMSMPPFSGNATGFRQAMTQAERRNETLSSRTVHLSSTWAKLVKRIGIARRPSG